MKFQGTLYTQAGGDTYWNSGESWGLVWNPNNPNNTANGTGRFFLYNGATNCIADKVTGLLWANNLIVNKATMTYPDILRTPDSISCNGLLVANAGLNGGAIARSRLPSLREMASIIDFRYNQTNGNLFGFSSLSYDFYNTAATRATATGLSSVLYYDLNSATGGASNNIYPNFITSATKNSFNWNNSQWSNNLGSSMVTSGGYVINYNNKNLINYVLVATLPTTVIQPIQPLLKSIDPAINSALAGRVNCDAYCQESPSYIANSNNGGVGTLWPTRGNWPNSISKPEQNIYGKNRYVSDPTGDCMIDLATGLIFQQKFGPSNFKGDPNNNDLSNSVNSFNKVGGSFYGLCGLKNWREANIRELEATWNYAMDGQININLYKNSFSTSTYSASEYYNPSANIGVDGLFYTKNTSQLYGYVMTSTISSGLNNITSNATSSTASGRRVLPVQEFGGNNRQYFAIGSMNYTADNYAYIPVAGGAARIQP